MFMQIVDRLRSSGMRLAEIEALGSDLAIPRADMAELVAARPAVRSEMDAMARCFGVDPAAVDRERWRALDMVRTCASCARMRDCVAFLNGRPGNFELADCPNAPHYAELKAAVA